MRTFSFFFLLWGCSKPDEKASLDSSGFPEDSGEASQVDPLDWSVASPGPYQVGYRSFEVTYSPGTEFEDRTIRLNIWYPTEDESGAQAEYTVGVDERAYLDAEPASPVHEGGYPVHVHSHGFQGYGATSAFLSRYFATHGWLTIAPDHTSNTLLDHRDPLPSAHYFHRPLDVRVALDTLAGLPSEDPLAGLANVDRSVISGHSFGAYTTWSSLGAKYDLDRVAEMCASGEGIHDDGCTPEEEAMFATELADPRIVASIPMAGTLRRNWFGDVGEVSVQGPVLFFGGSEDDRGQQEQFDQIGQIDFTWMELEGACHQTFALGACGTLDTDLGFSIVETIGLAFARWVVLGDNQAETTAIATGEQSISEIVTTQRRLGG